MPIATRRPTKPAPAPSRIAAARARLAPVAAAPAPPAGPIGEPAHYLDVPFALRGIAEGAGAYWDKAVKSYVYYGPELPWELEPYASELYSWERLREDERNIERGHMPEAPKARPPEKDVTLRPHQLDGARAIYRAMKARRTGFLVADDVGLGKTIETWKAVLHAEAETVLVVCPLAVVAHWRRTIRWMGDGGKRVVVINYDRLKKLFEVPAQLAEKTRRRRKGRKVRTQKGIARYGEAYEFDLIIWDESHRLRNVEAARFNLASKLDAEADFRIWLSATAGQNPLELAYLAPLLAESTGSKVKDLAEFEKWCQGQGIGVTRGKFGKWEWRGNSDEPTERAGSDDDLVKVRGMLFGGALPVGIRRSPTDIAGWPEINRILLPVVLEGEDRLHYEQAWGEFRDALDLERTGKADPKNALVVRLRFRQKASLLRTGFTVDHVEELLAQGLQVAVSVAFRETLDVIRDALKASRHAVAEIHGGQSAGEKERQRLDFQHGRARVCLYTVEEGISLHQGEYNDVPRANVIHDVRWSAIQMKQIEGRTHRDGRFSQIYWMVGDGTVEERLANVVGRRVRSMSLMQGDAATVDEIEGLLKTLAASARRKA